MRAVHHVALVRILREKIGFTWSSPVARSYILLAVCRNCGPVGKNRKMAPLLILQLANSAVRRHAEVNAAGNAARIRSFSTLARAPVLFPVSCTTAIST